MVALWIPVTVAAAFLQNLRSAQQKALTGRLSTGLWASPAGGLLLLEL